MKISKSGQKYSLLDLYYGRLLEGQTRRVFHCRCSQRSSVHLFMNVSESTCLKEQRRREKTGNISDGRFGTQKRWKKKKKKKGCDITTRVKFGPFLFLFYIFSGIQSTNESDNDYLLVMPFV